jgi:DNA-binding Lrp family transcriptional regulator
MTSDVTDNTDAELLLTLQRGITLVERPYSRICGKLGLSEEHVVERLASYLETGIARRFGAVFDSRGLGYNSTLCAVDVPHDDLDRAAGLVTPHPGVTHCYEREGSPNLWFTVTAHAESLQDELARMADLFAPYRLLDLPAIKRFKIQAVFDTRKPDATADSAAGTEPGPPQKEHNRTTALQLNEQQRSIVRRFQGMIPLTSTPFSDAAAELEMETEALLSMLTEWKDTGALRRIALIVRHRKLGFNANSMCVWPATPDKVTEAGPILAGNKAVTHCYERPSFDSFPFNLYAMVHADTPDAVTGLFNRLSSDAGLSDGRMMVSAREFKKSSPVFFYEEDVGVTTDD